MLAWLSSINDNTKETNYNNNMNDQSSLTERLDDLVSRIEKMTSQDIQLIGGEMSRQELRTSRALLDWVVREMRANVTGGV